MKTLQEIGVEFDETFARKSQNPSELGKPRPDWFFPDHITPKQVKKFFLLHIDSLLNSLRMEEDKETVKVNGGETETLLAAALAAEKSGFNRAVKLNNQNIDNILGKDV